MVLRQNRVWQIAMVLPAQGICVDGYYNENISSWVSLVKSSRLSADPRSRVHLAVSPHLLGFLSDTQPGGLKPPETQPSAARELRNNIIQ